MAYSGYSNSASATTSFQGIRPLGETDHGAGYNSSTLWSVLVELESNLRTYHRAHTVSYSYSGHTLQQSGAKWAMWSGRMAFDSTDELFFLRSLFLVRLFYWQDFTPASPADPVLVYWAGDFQPQFHDPELESGFVPFTLISKLSGISIADEW